MSTSKIKLVKTGKKETLQRKKKQTKEFDRPLRRNDVNQKKME